jgi:hypothetical protein
MSTAGAAAVDRALDPTIEALPEPRLNSDLDDELIRILSGEGPGNDLDAVIRGLSKESSDSEHAQIEAFSGRTSNSDPVPPVRLAAPILARFLPLRRVQIRPRRPGSAPPANRPAGY